MDITWGYESVKEVVDFISQDAGYFFGFLLVAGIATEFVIRMTHIIVVKGITSLLKMIFKGIGQAVDYFFKDKDDKK